MPVLAGFYLQWPQLENGLGPWCSTPVSEPKIPILTNIFQRGWNHQLDKLEDSSILGTWRCCWQPGGEHKWLTFADVGGSTFTPSKFNMAPEKWWLEDEISFWGPAYFQGRTVKLPGSKFDFKEESFSRWWQLKYFLFSPRNLGKMNPFWRAYFSKGLKPPTCFFVRVVLSPSEDYNEGMGIVSRTVSVKRKPQNTPPLKINMGHNNEWRFGRSFFFSK